MEMQEELAFEIPNSRFLVTIKETKGYNLTRNSVIRYKASLLIKPNLKSSGCETVFFVLGETEMNAVEILFEKIVKASEMCQYLFDIKNNNDIEKVNSFHKLPLIDKDSVRKFISLLLDNYEQKKYKLVFFKSTDVLKYSAGLTTEDGLVVFQALANGDKEIAYNNLMNIIYAVGANLEKLQEAVWNIFLDINDTKSVIKTDMFGYKQIRSENG